MTRRNAPDRTTTTTDARPRHAGSTTGDRHGRRSGRPRAIALAATVVAMTLLLTACEGLVGLYADNMRADLGLPALGRSTLLADAARANSASMCAAGTTSPSADPKADYDQQSIAAADELVGSTVLDTAITDPDERNRIATTQIWNTWKADPTWTDTRWDDLGVGEATCGDGKLYLTAALTERPSMPATGRYSSYQATTAQLTGYLGLTYGNAVNYLGQNQALQLDLYLPPPTGTPRPLVIFVHGGSFQGGARTDMTGAAQDFARRGYAAATISYRLNPGMGTSPPPDVYLQSVINAIDDGMESVRWLRANAATYGIDPNRIAMLGSSAGGGVSLGVGLADDLTPGGPLAGVSPKLQATVSTGASLTQGLSLVGFQSTDSPILMFHHELDTATHATDEYAMQTCTALRDAGGTCDFVLQAGEGHTVSISSSGPYFTPNIGPFLWEHLDLG